MKRIAGAILCLTVLSGFPAGAAEKFLPFDDIRKGMRGHGLTVFEGTRIEEFPIEVIGLLPRVAPRRNLFLVRLSGDRLQETGIAGGMSGSPIYLEGVLAGALSYGWSFSKQPIGAVTPIHEMLDLLGDNPPRSASLSSSPGGRKDLQRLFSPEDLLGFFDDYLTNRRTVPRGGAVPLRSLPIPLTVSGIDSGQIPFPQFEKAGFWPIPASRGPASNSRSTSAGPSPGVSPPPLRPGSAVSVKLIRGDVEISAVGTVTYSQGDRVLAFGHPLLNLGATDLPMAGAEVQAILPSFATSFKFANPLEEVGSFRQDRMVGLAGRAGVEAEMIPVRLDLDLTGGRTQEYRFELIRTGYLSPFLLYLALNGILSAEREEYGEPTMEIREGSTILLLDQENISLRNQFAGPLAPFITSAMVAYILHIVMANEYETPKVAGINLRLRHREVPRSARIERIWCDRGTVRPGETVTLSVALRPYREAEVTRTLQIEIPEELSPGRLLLQVGDGLNLSRRELAGPVSPPRDLSQLIWLINHIRTNDNIYVLLTRQDGETVIRGERFPHLPPSKASILFEPQVNEDLLYRPERRILEDAIPTDYVITGLRSLVLQVRH